jgi:hypothetical protein
MKYLNGEKKVSGKKAVIIKFDIYKENECITVCPGRSTVPREYVPTKYDHKTKLLFPRIKSPVDYNSVPLFQS